MGIQENEMLSYVTLNYQVRYRLKILVKPSENLYSINVGRHSSAVEEKARPMVSFFKLECLGKIFGRLSVVIRI